MTKAEREAQAAVTAAQEQHTSLSDRITRTEEQLVSLRAERDASDTKASKARQNLAPAKELTALTLEAATLRDLVADTEADLAAVRQELAQLEEHQRELQAEADQAAWEGSEGEAVRKRVTAAAENLSDIAVQAALELIDAVAAQNKKRTELIGPYEFGRNWPGARDAIQSLWPHANRTVGHTLASFVNAVRENKAALESGSVATLKAAEKPVPTLEERMLHSDTQKLQNNYAELERRVTESNNPRISDSNLASLRNLRESVLERGGTPPEIPEALQPYLEGVTA